MQTCYNCGRQVEDNVLICPDCGALVKRYGRPEPQTQQPVQPRDPYQDPRAYRDPMYAPDANAQGYDPAYTQTQQRGAVRVLPDGQRKFGGFACFWLVLCAIGAGYMALGFGSMLLMYGNQQLYLDTLSAFPELSGMLSLVQAVLADVEAYHLVYVLRFLFFAAKCAAIIWLLVSKRKAAFYAVAVCTGLSAITLILGGGGMSGIVYALDLPLTWLMLRGSWKLLR